METSRPLKIYFLPFFSPGHLIPLVQLARLVAARGQHVTIVTTPSNAQLFDKSIDEDTALGHHIRVHVIKFPNTIVGLPEGIEHLSAATNNETGYKIHMAAHLIQPQVEAIFKNSPPDVFIPDIIFTWSKDFSRRLLIPRLVFNPISIFDVCLIDAVKKHPEAFQDGLAAPYQIPDLPHRLTLPVKPSPGFAALTESLLDGEEDSHGVIVNSFADLDAEYTQHYEKLTGRKVWHVGPSSLMVQTTVKSIVDENNRHECLTWLDSKEEASVFYICFGSLSLISDEQLYQIATGLEGSGHCFLWVVHRKKKDGEEEEEESSGKWLPEGFEERMRKEKRGMVMKGWAPQPLILNHRAVGGFLTHCGWNAVVEAISSGVPMVTMPGFGDQYYNEKLITEVHGFGVEVGAAEWSISPYDGKKEVVSGERIEKAVKRLMDEGEEKVRFRSKAKEMQEKAWKAVREGGSSHNSLTTLIDHFKSLQKKVPNPDHSKGNGFSSVNGNH